jgi:tetratricopeptide (TPR) repeat protein
MTLDSCVPHRNLRAKRKRVTLAAVVLMVGALAVVLGGKEGRHFMMPGKLSAPHAGLTNCSTCHAGARSGQLDLLHRLFTAVEPRQNSNLCVTCHVMGAEPFAPHTHPVEDLRRLSETLRSASKNWPPESTMQRITFPLGVRSREGETEIYCATCHKEHQGVFANLKTVSNKRCQTCHVLKFGTFADSHPQFTKFPYKRRPRIIFDHQSHAAKHFPEAIKAAIAGQAVPDNCADCHQPGVRRRYMEVKSFATMCSGCHNGDIIGATRVSGPKGIDVIAVPGLDLKTLSERGIDIGGWPQESEAVLTPFTRLLLDSTGENVVSAVAGLNLLDLSKASDQDLARVAALAWAVKRLFNWLETTNPTAARVTAQDKSGTQIYTLEMAALTGGMSHDVIMAGNHEWFRDLQDDLQRHEHGEPTRDFKPPAKQPMTDAAKSPAASPYGSGEAVAAAKVPGAASSDDILAPEKKASGNKDDILSASNKDDSLAPSKGDDILAQNNTDDILSGDKPAASNALTVVGDGAALPSRDGKTSVGAKPAGAGPAPFDPEVWAQAGGWYREDFAIRYRPTGHADQFLQAWLDFAGRAYGSNQRDRLTPVFDELASTIAVGRCTKCHSVDTEAGAKIVNWHPFDPNAINNRFTNYSHKPHIELIGTKTCAKCHELRQTESGFLKTYEGGDPVNYTPNFKYFDKALCAACHSQQSEWETCTLCHGYHVPDVDSSSPVPTTPAGQDKLIVSEAGAAIQLLDPDAVVGRDYAMAKEAGTQQAWDDFVSRYPSGRYHDLAIQQIAKLNPAAPGTAERSDESPPKTSDKAALATSGESAPSTSDKSTPVNRDTSAPAPPGKLATVAPESSATATSTNPADADTSEPSDLDGFYRRGLEWALRGDYNRAKQYFGEVIGRDPRHAGALNNRCWVRAMLDELQAALEDCEASLRVAPNYPDAFDSRGLVNLKLGFYKQAIADYTAALSQLHGLKRASALYGRGIAKRRIGNIAGAKSDIDASKIIFPAIADEFANYGIQ